MDERPPPPSPAGPVAGHLLGGCMFLFCLVLWLGLNWHSVDWGSGATQGGPPHLINWGLGWLLLWAGVVAGTVYGLFASDDPATARQQRILWLGLAAGAAAGVINVLFGLSSCPAPMTLSAGVASLCFVLTGVCLPGVCFLTLWRPWARFLVIVPLFTLSLGVVATLRGAVDNPPAGLFDALQRQ